MTAVLDLLDELPDIDAANVARCARVLLRRPLLRAGGPDGDLLPLVYRHRVTLQELFARLLGYRLVVERRFARLYKAGPGADDTRGEPHLTPHAYAYLALTMAVLTGAGRQMLLSRLVADVRAAAVEAGVPAPDDAADRRALTAALRHLVHIGVLTETEGTVATAADGVTSPAAEALITVDTDLLGQLLAGPVGEAGSPDELVELAARPGPLDVAHAVRRRLVEDPVVLHAELPAEQADWLRRNHRRESVVLERCFNLRTETRLEGILASDPEDYLTDVLFPGTSTVARIALLALPRLLEGAEDAADGADSAPERADGRVPVTVNEVRGVCADLVKSYPAAWSRQVTEDVDRLVGEVLGLLRRIRLARPDGDGRWLLSPAAHRWLPEPDGAPEREQPATTPPEQPSWSLFDGNGPEAPGTGTDREGDE
ncbi:TIGR02678 family protein [Gandjariella thermophila]|uniref:TIGR02678 family protein n=1 Tax=Gandjariella thermophila TaxID=1931992 RepID=A0A4D4JCL1_9PSEU|nr:TIGR02678 family protein [Gandjariella thermophila]GDY33112.1 hypothetical protein GTS_47450 [Gandjariella thermophila]